MGRPAKDKGISLPYNFDARWYQMEAFQAFDKGKKKLLLVWARRAGKDLFCWNLLVREAFKTTGVYYYFFPTYEQARKAVWENIDNDGRKMLDYIPGISDKTPNSYVKRISNQSMVVELANGSIIRLVAADQVEESIVGTNPRLAIFSEFSLQDPMGLKLMLPVFAINKGSYIINGTPRGQNHFYKLYKTAIESPEWFVSYLPIDKLNLYTKEELDAMAESFRVGGMTDDEIKQEMYCSWSAGNRGAYYADLIEKAQDDGRLGEFVEDTTCYVDTFWDLGIGDDTTIWFKQIQKNKIVFIDFYSTNGQSISHYVDILKSKGYKYRTHFIPWDGNQRKDTGSKITTTSELLRDQLRQAGLEDDVVVAPRAPVQQGINLIRQRFSLYHFNEVTCKQGLDALIAYHRKWDAYNGVYSAHPVHDWSSHAADALRTEAVCENLTSDYFNTGHKAPVVDSDFDLF
jgi:hypothetical protein